jgi:hypothetical protein
VDGADGVCLSAVRHRFAGQGSDQLRRRGGRARDTSALLLGAPGTFSFPRGTRVSVRTEVDPDQIEKPFTLGVSYARAIEQGRLGALAAVDVDLKMYGEACFSRP